MGGDSDPCESLEYLVEQERELFKLYEGRREAVETQATALTAAGLTIGALILVAVRTSDESQLMAGVALVSLAPTIGLAVLTRFVGWNWPRLLGAPSEDRSIRVAETLEDLRRAAEDRIELRRAALAHWRARAESAEGLGAHKKRLLVSSLVGLLPALVFLFARGVQLVSGSG